MGKDVCDVLGTRTDDIRKILDDDERGTESIRILGGKQVMTVISESGLYALVLKSRRPEAKSFRRWVTKEVLPTIRKTGAYMTDNTLNKIKDEGSPVIV